MNLEKQIRCSLGVVRDMMVARGNAMDVSVDRVLDEVLDAYTTSATRHTETSNLLAMDIGCAMVMYVLQHKQQRMADLRKRLDAVVSGMTPTHHTVIMVTHNMTEANINAICKSISAMCASQNHKVLMQHFYMRELQYNITHHEMVPRHEIVHARDVPGIVQKYGLRSKHQLPWICRTDPMSKFLGLCHGDVIQITRPSKQALEYKVYRVCA